MFHTFQRAEPKNEEETRNKLSPLDKVIWSKIIEKQTKNAAMVVGALKTRHQRQIHLLIRRKLTVARKFLENWAIKNQRNKKYKFKKSFTFTGVHEAHYIKVNNFLSANSASESEKKQKEAMKEALTVLDWKNYALWRSYKHEVGKTKQKKCNRSKFFEEVLEQMSVYEKESLPKEKIMLMSFMKGKFFLAQTCLREWEINNKTNCDGPTPSEKAADVALWSLKAIPCAFWWMQAELRDDYSGTSSCYRHFSSH